MTLTLEAQVDDRGVDIDLHLADGDRLAVLGPNGAGKSTTMRMLTTLIAPTAGSATVAGHDVIAESAQVRRLIGYVGQGNGAGHNQRVGDELNSQGLTSDPSMTRSLAPPIRSTSLASSAVCCGFSGLTLIRSPAKSALSASAVSSAITSPWSTTTTRPAIESASSR